MWEVVFTKQAAKDAKNLKAVGLDKKAKTLVEAVRTDPFAMPPAYEGLIGNLSGLYSRRISIQHRFVYRVIDGAFEKDGKRYKGTVKVVRMWTYYEGLRK